MRDRDSPVTKEGLIFRVYGYTHPPHSCICDVEYAPEGIYSSDDPRALRQAPSRRFYKFYVDGGLRFVRNNYPQYQVLFEPLQRKLVGLTKEHIAELRKPEDRLSFLLSGERSAGDKLMSALQDVLDVVTNHSKLHLSDFGVFGSILHGFYHPDFSDLDFTVYGRKNTRILRETLRDVYGASSPSLVNEFDESIKWTVGRRWDFSNISIKEFCECCRRKMIYAIYRPQEASRDFKVEFEPVRDWSEIEEDYDSDSRIKTIGWTRLIAEVLEDSDSFFIPSVYPIEVKKILSGPNAGPIEKIVSYVEEFRGQAETGEKVIVEGGLEKVTDSKGERYQITLTRASDYYKQVLKPASSSDNWWLT